ncbi:uncharacterized protein LOC124277317 isoform X2 [Haliotis rubra]|uniref:uncharacterized protein LOC124277317 isoform X2 n=1 Tax=Haliotis rubra TaxID=36100 RepID=UPI001EE4FC1E|nr:uncharacterized protein LOC124277317 isoform X2 [Haliotis rubra]
MITDCKEIPHACRRNFRFWREAVHPSRRYYLCVDHATYTAIIYTSGCVRVDTQTGVRFTMSLSIETLCSDPAYRLHDNGSTLLDSHNKPQRQRDISDVDNGSLPREEDANDTNCDNKTDCSHDDVDDNGTVDTVQNGKGATSGSHAVSEGSRLPSVPILPTVAMVVIATRQAW